MRIVPFAPTSRPMFTYYTGRPRTGAYTGSPFPNSMHGLGAAAPFARYVRPNPYRPRPRPVARGPFGAITHAAGREAAIEQIRARKFGGRAIAPPPGKEAARMEFVAWVRRKHPELYRAAIDKMQLSGLGDTPATSTSFLDTISALGSKYLAFREQQQLLQMNAQRAAAGAPPVSSLTPQGAAAAGTAMPAYAAPTYSASLMDTINGLSTPVKIAGAAALGFLGYSLLNRRRR